MIPCKIRVIILLKLYFRYNCLKPFQCVLACLFQSTFHCLSSDQGWATWKFKIAHETWVSYVPYIDPSCFPETFIACNSHKTCNLVLSSFSGEQTLASAVVFAPRPESFSMKAGLCVQLGEGFVFLMNITWKCVSSWVLLFGLICQSSEAGSQKGRVFSFSPFRLVPQVSPKPPSVQILSFRSRV